MKLDNETVQVGSECELNSWPESVKASERNSVVAGSNPTQKGLSSFFQISESIARYPG